MQAFSESILISIQQHSEWAWLFVFIIAFAESMAIIGLLIPGWALLLGIGTLIGSDLLEFFPIVVSAYFGAVVGEYLSYYVGYHYHEAILKWRYVASHQDLIDRSIKFFDKYGIMGVFFGRFIGPVRAVIPLVAGVAQMPKQTFFWVNLTSGLIWAPLYLIPGILVGAAFNLDKEVSNALLLILLLLAFVLWLALKQSGLLYKVLNNGLQRNRSFAIINATLAWTVFVVLLFVLTQSEYFSHLEGIFQVLKTKVFNI